MLLLVVTVFAAALTLVKLNAAGVPSCTTMVTLTAAELAEAVVESVTLAVRLAAPVDVGVQLKL
jgi:hypothetical protein